MNTNQMTLLKKTNEMCALPCFFQNLNIFNILIIEVGEANTDFPSEDATETRSFSAPLPGHFILFLFSWVRY